MVRSPKSKDKPISVALLPHVQATYDRLSSMFAKHIESVGLKSRKISSFLRPVKDDLGLRTLVGIPCECGQVYIGQTGRSMESKIKEHHRHIRLAHPEKSAVAERSFKQDRLKNFQDIRILSVVPEYVNRRITEATELELNLNNMKKKDGLTCRGSSKPISRLFIESRWPPALVVTSLRPH